MTYSSREVERDQATHDHYAKNALATGHEPTCEMVVGAWTTAQGVAVNWPTLRGRPDCTCGKKDELNEAEDERVARAVRETYPELTPLDEDARRRVERLERLESEGHVHAPDGPGDFPACPVSGCDWETSQEDPLRQQ